jgi:hypothetical protein
MFCQACIKNNKTMITAAHIINTIKNLRNGKTTDDKSISDYQWLFICDYYRAVLIRQQQSKGQTINEQCVQKLNPNSITLTINPLEKCEMMSNSLPKAIEGHTANLFTFVGTEGGRGYQRTTYNKSQWDSQSKYVGHLPKWYMLGSKMMVKHHSKNLKLNIHGLFENPIEVERFNGTLNEMDPFSFEYPISNVLLDSVLKLITESELKLNMVLTKDNLNDGKDGEQQRN